MLTYSPNRHWQLYTGAFALVIIASASIYLVADSLGVTVKTLTRDPYSAAGVPAYYGYVSLLGSTIWLIAGAGTLIVSLFAKRVFHARMSDDGTYRIIVIGGATGLMMAFDDILLLHDAFAIKMGISELFFHGFYLLCMLLLIGTARGLLLRTPWILLLSSLACFGMSSVIDKVYAAGGQLSESEDVFKFSAIIFWAIYFAQVCWHYMGSKNVLNESVNHS